MSINEKETEGHSARQKERPQQTMTNAKVKQIMQWQKKSKERRKDKVFLVEGLKMFEEAPPECILEVYLSESMDRKLKGSADQKDKELYCKVVKTRFDVISDDLFAKISDTQTPQGILSVLKQPDYSLERLLECENPLFVILENLQDPGNLGTILRTGEGAGITGVIMNNGTVDIFNPKTIRATMGSIYRVPFIYVESLPDTIEKLHQRGVHTYAAHLQGKDYFQSLSFQEPTVFLIGNEGNGLTKETADLAEKYLKIPMEGKVESLNAAVATALLSYEAYRQRHL